MSSRGILLAAGALLIAAAVAAAAGSPDAAEAADATTAPDDSIDDVDDVGGVPVSTTSGSAPRGIRNNNPGNIVATSIAWRGKTGNDGTFEIFDNAQDGIRALALNLLSKYRRGLVSIRQLITSWAPPAQNNTASYIAFVSTFTGFGADTALNLDDAATLTDLTDAIITQENGYNPYPAATIATGVNAALG